MYTLSCEMHCTENVSYTICTWQTNTLCEDASLCGYLLWAVAWEQAVCKHKNNHFVLIINNTNKKCLTNLTNLDSIVCNCSIVYIVFRFSIKHQRYTMQTYSYVWYIIKPNKKPYWSSKCHGRFLRVQKFSVCLESELLDWIISVKNNEMCTSEPIRELKAVVDLSTKIGPRIYDHISSVYLPLSDDLLYNGG